MSGKNDIELKLEAVKSILHGLKAEEQEAFRSHLISWLLFSGPGDAPRKPAALRGLTDKERDLIQRLADQADRLNKLLNDEDPDKQDQ
jgi:hypothetical protein